MTIQESKDYQEVKHLITQGHTRRCAFNMVLGNGCCTCNHSGLKDIKEQAKKVIEVIKNE